MASLELIAHKLDEVQDRQSETADKVSDIREGLYDPSAGVFARLNSQETWAENHQERDDELRKHVEAIAANMEPLTLDYKIRKSTSKWTDKIKVFALITGLGIGVAAVKNLFIDSDRDSGRLDKLERSIKQP